MADSAVFHRELTRPIIASEGKGSWISDGPNSYLDLSSGAGVTCLGYDAISVKAAMHQQIDRLPYVHSGNWTTQMVEGLAETLLGLTYETANGSPRAWRKGSVFFLNSGAEAVEAACKLAAQHFMECGQLAPTFFGRLLSYHGNSLFTLALGDHPRKELYYASMTTLPGVQHFDAYTPSIGDPSPDAALRNLELSLNEAAENRSPAVVIVETIGGMTIGIEPPTVDYLVALRRLCDRFHAVLIYDEVLCGNYRTGNLFAWQTYQKQTLEYLDPDIVVMGKGLTAGYFPLSAVIVSGRIMESVRTGSRKLWHSTTNQNHAIGCAAGFAALGLYERHRGDADMLARTVGNVIVPELLKCALVTTIIGKGTLYGIRLLPGARDLHKRVRKLALSAGLSLYSDGATINGRGNTLLLAPQYTMGLDQLEQGVKILVDILNTESLVDDSD